MKKNRVKLLTSLIAMILCLALLVGTTMAWFTDSVGSGYNEIAAGNLDVELEYKDAAGKWQSVTGSTNVFKEDALWEPGYTEVVYLRLSNAGDLALNYKFGINIAGETGSYNAKGEAFKLSDHIKFGVVESDTHVTYGSRDAARDALAQSFPLSQSYTSGTQLYPVDNAEGYASEKYVALVVYMPESVDNVANHGYGQTPPEIHLGLRMVATQQTYESDSFGADYDVDAELPDFNFTPGFINDSVTVSVTTDDAGKVAEKVTLVGGRASAEVPVGVQLEPGVKELTLSVHEITESEANLTVGDNERQRSLDVHVEGIAADNTVPITVSVSAAAPKGLNIGNYEVYHVENDTPVEMTLVNADAEFTDHNQFKYDPATGDITLYMATFSEVAMVVDNKATWTGNYDYTWYDAEKTVLTIANADQLAGFGAIVGGMNGQTRDSFAGKTVKLVCGVDLNDTDSENEMVFYPIGYYNSTDSYEKTSGGSVTSGFKTFEGTFDGNGNTIGNFYQNTWEMFGDYNDGYSGTPNHYRDGMGLFGKVYGGTVKNLTIINFSSDGEFTTTGSVAAYADCGATFENIAIFHCNPRVYNIGNGGIVGCVGWYAEESGENPVTFRNITVDNSNKISALWGSWDVSCGGLVGQYYPTSGQGDIANKGIHMENCHVAAQIDVNNDVCANYQYYAYRYAGILIGSVRENEEVNGHVYPKMNGITASGCTVHFGDWNDYYYCELVANTLASYTHDHQMSRLVQVKELKGTSITYLDGTTGTVPTSGRYNYVVVNGNHATENAKCYHFVDGAVWNHDTAGTETVDGQEVKVEDKQHLYLEFNNLVTGYGWGVTSKGVGELDGVTILDRTEGESVVKFEVQDGIATEQGSSDLEQFRANNTISVSKLFKAAEIADPNLSIIDNTVRVTVSPVYNKDSNNNGSTVGAIFSPNTTDWTRGTLLFTGHGDAVVTITDYYYCKSTSVKVNIVENAVTGLSIKTNKHVYDIAKNETFSPEDITVTAVYSDGMARILDSDEFSYQFWKDADSDFTVFGNKTCDVTYTYAQDTVYGQFTVTAVNTNELSLEGVPESGVVGETRIERYFEQFGINAAPQKYYLAPGGTTVENGTAQTLPFATGSVDFTVNSHAGSAKFDETDKNGQITINCTTAPFADIFGYVGYAEAVPIAFGVYVDTVDNLTYTRPMDANADIIKLTGTENSRIFYIQAPLNTMNLSAGEHKVHFISIFDDGIQHLTTWTVNVAAKEEVDISTKTANVVILAGQSNAYGASGLTEAVKGAASADYSNIFINYSNINCDNGTWKSLFYNANFEPYHPGVGGTVNGACFGPEVGMAYQLATSEATKDEVWYIVKYTAAGSILDGQWLEGTYDNEGLVGDMGGYLSDLMINYVDDALTKIATIHGDNIKVHAFTWMQGESDALALDCADEYQANEAALVNKVRSEYAKYAKDGNGDNIIFVSGGIAKFADIEITQTGEKASNGWTYSDKINAAKKANAKIDWDPVANGIDSNSGLLPNSAWIDTSSLLVGANAGENNDVYHYSSASMWNLGNWFGAAVNHIAGLMK